MDKFCSNKIFASLRRRFLMQECQRDILNSIFLSDFVFRDCLRLKSLDNTRKATDKLVNLMKVFDADSN